jgi:hypothetical protein
MDTPIVPDIDHIHEHEEKLRRETMALIASDAELSRRLRMVEGLLALISAYTLSHRSKFDDEATMQLLGIRLFNAGASGLKLALSGYYQTAFHQARDIMETGFLLDFFRTSPEQRAVWKSADRPTRRKLFDPVKIRIALDARDGDTARRRKPSTTSFPSLLHTRPCAGSALRRATVSASLARLSIARAFLRGSKKSCFASVRPL